jgi:intein/homing endonuclease
VSLFYLNQDFIQKFVGQQPKWGPIGYVTYKRTYARDLDKIYDRHTQLGLEAGLVGNEEFWLTLTRVTEGTFGILRDHCKSLRLPWDSERAQQMAQEMFLLMWNFKFLPPGRGLWMMGCPVIEKIGSTGLNNCGYASSENIDLDFSAPFCSLMDFSMLGVGMGGDASGADKITIKKAKRSNRVHEVADSREGWVNVLRVVLDAYVELGDLPEFDYSQVRKAGSSINGFGGTASGPAPLQEMVVSICSVLDRRAEQPILSSDIVDIFNLVGRCVVAGGVRRTAEILFGESDDDGFLELKDRDKNAAALDSHRWASNNSIFAKVGQRYGNVAKRTAKNGEPGYFWLKNAQNYGRMIDPPDYKDKKAKGGNPCVTGDTIIATSEGDLRVDQLLGEPFIALVHGQPFLSKNGFFSTGNQPVIELTTCSGYTIKVTPNHLMLVDHQDNWIEAGKLVAGDLVVMNMEAFETIRKIDYVGVLPVYDCTVEKTHRFSANKFIVHNCLEQTLEDGELCNLVETFPFHHENIKEYTRTLKFAYLYAKTVTLVPTHNPKTNAVTMKNRRIGCSMSGIVQAMSKFGRRGFLDLCDAGYAYVCELDKEYSGWLCVPESIKKTSVKPSGCRPWNALTSTDKGLLTLEEMFADHPDTEEWAVQSQGISALQGNVKSKVIKTFANGESDIIKVTLNYGLVVESTPNHMWAVNNIDGDSAWVRADQLVPEQVLDVKLGAYFGGTASELASVNGLAIKMRGDATQITQPSNMTEDLAWLLGYLWGDGCMSPCGYRIRFSDARVSNLDKANRVLSEVFGLSGTVQKVKTSVASSLEIGSKYLWHWLIRNGLFKYYGANMDLIPERVRTSKASHVIAFIAGLLDSDGCVSKMASGKHKAIWTTADATFAQHLQDVCWAVGLGVGRSHNTKGNNFQKRKSMYLLTLGTKYTTDAYQALVANSVKCSEIVKSPIFEGWHGENAGRSLVVGKVISIEPGPRVPTYDIEVENTHWYYAGSVRSHNTISLLPQATPGIHHPIAEFYWRVIRFATDSHMLPALRASGLRCIEIDPAKEPNTTAVYFPVKEEGFERGAKDVSMWEQLELAAALQAHWADNQVSVTVTFDKKTEGPQIARALELYETRLKGVSFLPNNEHGYEHAPYQPITEEEYLEAKSKLLPLDLSRTSHEVTDKFCDGDKCMLPGLPQS